MDLIQLTSRPEVYLLVPERNTRKPWIVQRIVRRTTRKHLQMFGQDWLLCRVPFRARTWVSRFLAGVYRAKTRRERIYLSGLLVLEQGVVLDALLSEALPRSRFNRTGVHASRLNRTRGEAAGSDLI